MNTTQDHLPIQDIKDDIVLLKDGGAALILQTTAVNFGLLSEMEQLSIITTYAQMLNSLSFAIQIVIDSKRLDISSYLAVLEKARSLQTNKLLSDMIGRYHEFIKLTIKENDVLDKRFYVVIPLSYLELGLMPHKDQRVQKAKNVLLPRKDQLVKQLGRIGLKATQLSTKELIELFFQIYNTPLESANIKVAEVNLAPPVTATPTIAPLVNPTQPVPIATERSKNHPFVVEELEET